MLGQFNDLEPMGRVFVVLNSLVVLLVVLAIPVGALFWLASMFRRPVKLPEIIIFIAIWTTVLVAIIVWFLYGFE